jgi:hypothetical protein
MRVQTRKPVLVWSGVLYRLRNMLRHLAVAAVAAPTPSSSLSLLELRLPPNPGHVPVMSEK